MAVNPNPPAYDPTNPKGILRPPKRYQVVYQKDNPSNWAYAGSDAANKIPNQVPGVMEETVLNDGTKIRKDINPSTGAENFILEEDRDPTIGAQFDQTYISANKGGAVTPEQRAAEGRLKTAEATTAEQEQNERSYNAQRGKGWLTHAQVAEQEQKQGDAASRLAEINARIAQIQQQAISTAETNALKRQELAQSAGQFDVTAGQTERRIGIDERRAGTEEAQLGLTQQQIDISKSQAQFQQGPQFELEKTKQAFSEKQAQLSNLLAARKIDQDTAIADMNNWWRVNVESAYKQDEAARMRSAEERQLQQLEDQSAQFAATHSLNRASLGVSAGNAAVEQEISTFPYKGGVNLGANMSSAINSLAKGSSAGVNFGPDDFNFTANLDKTRERATARALKDVSPYARNLVMQNSGRTSTPLPQVDFSTMPNFKDQGSVTDFIKQYYPSFIAQGGQDQQQPSE